MTTFLDLPPELRYMVYHSLWQHTPNIRRIRVKDASIELIAKYPPEHESKDLYCHGLPRWLLTNKTLLHEGLDQLNRHGHMYMGLLPPTWMSRKTEVHVKDFPSLLPPFACRSLEIGLLPVIGWTVPEPRVFGEIHEDELSYWREFFSEAAKSGRLQHVQLRFRGLREKQVSQAVNLTPLVTIMEPVAHKLKRLEVRMPYAVNLAISKVDALKEPFLKEMRRVEAEILMGMKGSLDSANEADPWYRRVGLTTCLLTWTRE